MDEPEYRTFIVVLDKENWANEDSLLFLWDDLRLQLENSLLQNNVEAMAGRLPGMKAVAGGLAGLIRPSVV